MKLAPATSSVSSNVSVIVARQASGWRRNRVAASGRQHAQTQTDHGWENPFIVLDITWSVVVSHGPVSLVFSHWSVVVRHCTVSVTALTCESVPATALMVTV